MAQFHDTHVGHRFNSGCRSALAEVTSTDCRDMTFLRMVVLASKTSLPTPDQALQGLFQTGACACPSGAHAHLIGGLPHLKLDDVAEPLADVDSSVPHPALWNSNGTYVSMELAGNEGDASSSLSLAGLPPTSQKRTRAIVWPTRRNIAKQGAQTTMRYRIRLHIECAHVSKHTCRPKQMR